MHTIVVGGGAGSRLHAAPPRHRRYPVRGGASRGRAHGYGIAMEGNITPRKGFPAKWKKAVGVDFGRIEGGYSWLFPKGDHLNIGIGGYNTSARNCGISSRDWSSSTASTPPVSGAYAGTACRNGVGTSPWADGNVLLVGDAAGILDPLTAEGISAAVHSAQIAATNIVQYPTVRQPVWNGTRRNSSSTSWRTVFEVPASRSFSRSKVVQT